MIIELDVSLAAALDAGGQVSDDVIAALQVCAQQAHEGNHVLVGKIVSLGRILKHIDKFDKRTAAVLLRSRDKAVQRKALQSFTKQLIRVTSSDGARVLRRHYDGTRTVIEISASAISVCSALVQAPVLMVENIDDGKLYIKLAESLVRSDIFSSVHWLREVPLKYEIAPGGGNTTARLYEMHRERNNRIGIAIADGDYRYPGARVGATAAALEASAAEDPRSPLLDTFILPVRTVENLIPRATIVAVARTIDKLQGIRAEDLISAYGSAGVWGYLPLKKGVKCFDTFGRSLESEFFSAICGGSTCEKLILCERREACDKYLVRPLSSQVLQKSANIEGPLQITKDCAHGLVELWARLIEIVYSYFCGAYEPQMI